MSEIVDLHAHRWAANQDPQAHSPATALGEAKRQIEAGEIEADHVIILYGYHDEDGLSHVGYFQAGEFKELAQVGLMARGLRLISSFDEPRE